MLNGNYLVYLFGSLALLFSIVITPFVIKLAHIRGWIVAPRKDRWHTKPTALMGGLGIFISFISIIFASSAYIKQDWLIVFAIFLMFITGLIDDLIELKPIYKLLAQVIAAFLIIYRGYIFGDDNLGLLGIPITFIFVIGITNAINLLDNMDGLSAGVSAIVAIISGILALQINNIPTALMAFVLAGSTLGFLFFNFNPAKIFMGDSGSLFLGFSLSYLSISVQKSIGTNSVYIILLLPLTILALPILDTSLVTLKRVISGRKVYMGGKDHTSHRLVALGLNEKKAVLILYGVALIWGMSAVFLINSNNSNLYLPTIAVLIIITSFFGLFLGRVSVYNESEEKLAYLRLRGQYMERSGFLVRFLLMNKKIIFGVSFDILVISTAFYFSSIISQSVVYQSYELLGLMISVKILCFFSFKSYRKSWRYISITDVNAYFISALLSTLTSFILASFLFKREIIPSGTFFTIDFFLTFFGVLFLRIVFKYIRETLLRFRTYEDRTLIYGAGELGNLLCRQLFISQKLSIKPIGFIDDDSSLSNSIINGIEVLGQGKDLLNVCKKFNISIVIIASDDISQITYEKFRNELENENIKIKRFQLEIK
jgi:UDP-GlcNAc:undecaprenyl-phosphate GlcNAc-1-phosphate transferase